MSKPIFTIDDLVLEQYSEQYIRDIQEEMKSGSYQVECVSEYVTDTGAILRLIKGGLHA